LGARLFIHRPLGQLVGAANQWRLGEFGRRVDIRGNSEFARVADAFNTMADALEYREHELSEAKEKAEEAAVRITTIFESTTDGVLIVDWNWRIGYVNGPASAQLAEDRDVIGMTLLEAFPHDTEILSRFREAMSEQRPAWCPSQTPAVGCLPTYGIGLLSPSSQPRRSARVPGSASAWSMASS
jgi:nitrogen fixation/metabolism regulation signal transduction histidine kinase